MSKKQRDGALDKVAPHGATVISEALASARLDGETHSDPKDDRIAALEVENKRLWITIDKINSIVHRPLPRVSTHRQTEVILKDEEFEIHKIIQILKESEGETS